MFKVLTFLSLIVLTGCATAPTCPTAEQEPVSYCRARAECKPSILGKIGIALGGAGAGANGNNNALERVNQCEEQNMSAQRASVGLKDDTCTLTQLDSKTWKANCH